MVEAYQRRPPWAVGMRWAFRPSAISAKLLPAARSPLIRSSTWGPSSGGGRAGCPVRASVRAPPGSAARAAPARRGRRWRAGARSPARPAASARARSRARAARSPAPARSRAGWRARAAPARASPAWQRSTPAPPRAPARCRAAPAPCSRGLPAPAARRAASRGACRRPRVSGASPRARRAVARSLALHLADLGSFKDLLPPWPRRACAPLSRPPYSKQSLL